jgi:hypothetical protein
MENKQSHSDYKLLEYKLGSELSYFQTVSSFEYIHVSLLTDASLILYL